MVHVRDLHEANTSLTDLNIGDNQIGDKGAAALAEASGRRLCSAHGVFLATMTALLLERIPHVEYGDFFSVPLEMDVLRQVWRAALCGGVEAYICVARTEAFIENTMTFHTAVPT